MSVAARNTAQSSHSIRPAMALAVMLGALVGCRDAADITGPAYPPAPVLPSVVRSEMIATVDLEAGTMTFETASRNAFNSAGINAAIYGNQGVTVRLYNSPVVVSASATPGKKLFSAMVGVKNLLSYPIGDEQGGAVPADTIGIDVFMVQDPSITITSSPCSPACTVTMRDHHGLRAFTAPNQKFWHWHDRLGAVNSGTDTTRTRTPFTFEADTQVTGFSFTVVLNAPWPAPYETRHKVDYQADSLPTTTAGSRWRLVRTADATASAASGALTLDPQSGEISYHRLDSLGRTQDAYIEARLKLIPTVPQQAGDARAFFMLADGTKLIALGIFPSGVGFVTSTGVLIGTKYSVTTTALRTYQLRKYAADSAVFFVDGVRGGMLPSASLPASPYGTASRVQFGATNSKKLMTSSWEYVIYELGAVSP